MTNSGFGCLRPCGSKIWGGSERQFAIILAAPMSGRCSIMRRKSLRTCSFVGSVMRLKDQGERGRLTLFIWKGDLQNNRFRGGGRALHDQNSGNPLTRRKRIRRHLAVNCLDRYLPLTAYSPADVRT